MSEVQPPHMSGWGCRSLLASFVPEGEAGMLQVHVVTAANRDLYRDQLELCFRQRHCLLQAPTAAPPSVDRESDRYDTEETTYLLAFRDNAFVAASRLRPFSAPTMLGEMFPHLANVRGVAQSATEAEWTRMFALPGTGEVAAHRTEAAMGSAVLEYCLDAGVHRLGGIHETYWLPRWADQGWRPVPLGMPIAVAGTPCLAVLFDVTPQALANVRRVAGIEQDQIVQIGPLRDFVTGEIQPGALLDPTLSELLTRLPKALP